MSTALNEDQFPIVPAIGFTLEKIWAERMALLRAARLPFAIILLADMAQIAFVEAPPADQPFTVWLLLTALLTLVVLAPLCIRWHRAVILGEGVDDPGPIFPESTGKYVIMQIIIGLLMFAAAIVATVPVAMLALIIGGNEPSEQIAMALAPLIMIIAFALTARLNLVLAAVAVDDGALGFREAWEITQGNALRIAAGLLMIVMLAVFVSVLLAAPVAPFMGEGAGLSVRAITSAIGIAQAIVFNLLFVGYFARAYLHFRGRSGMPDTT